MLFFPNCKINIGLDILRKRPDGYHDIETAMYPVYGLCDGLEIIRAEVPDGVEFTASGIPADCPAESNLVMKAFRLMQREYGIGGVRIHLHKTIPSGAGLGGGSSDAAFTIKGLDKLFGLGLSCGRMEELASRLGSDIPFFIRNVPQICSGRGEVMTPVDIPLRGKRLVIIKPDIHISTAEAYAGVTPAIPAAGLAERITQPIEKWDKTIENTFEKSLFKKYPELEGLKNALYEQGASYASMTGSGSAVYGIFNDKIYYKTNTYKDIFIVDI